MVGIAGEVPAFLHGGAPARGRPTGRERDVAGLQVITIETPSLGDRSYIAHDGSKAFIIDPQRDIDRVLPHIEDLGLDVTHVVETHVHND